MENQLVVVDDDPKLVKELRDHLKEKYASIPVVGLPELHLNLAGVRENVPGAAAIILDRNIGGIDAYGRTLLKKLRGVLKHSDTPVIVWSKYLHETVVFERSRISKLSDDPASPAKLIEEKDLEDLRDYSGEIEQFRELYRDTRAFVSKASPKPIELLCEVLLRLGIISLRSAVGSE